MVEVTMAVVLFAGIVLCVWLDQRGKTRRRQMEHVERMRALELGRSLDDAATSRADALAAIGASIGISSFAAAALATCFMIYYPLEALDGKASFYLLLLIWPVCALAAGGVALACIITLGWHRPAEGESADETPGASRRVTTRPREYGP
jgi:hypothetical protein